MRKHLYAKTRSMRDGSLALSLVMYALIIGFFLYALTAVGARQEKNEQAQLESAIRRALVSCYAAEGRYPKSIAYLQENYGVALDEKRYMVYYDAYAENLLPDVRVVKKEGAS